MIGCNRERTEDFIRKGKIKMESKYMKIQEKQNDKKQKK